jgi:rhamnogalacturonyl hydrolase YesR
MARWEVAEQLPDGGVRAGTMAAEIVAPTIFNTGQVLFGLARAARETGDEAIHRSLVRASDWLVAAQDEDGCWRRFGSPFALSKNGTYNTRSAFGLVRAFEIVGDRRYLEAADRNVAWALSTAKPNAWLPGNCLTTNADDSALTHTIAYSIRGILEVGVAVEKPEYVKAALTMAQRVAERQNADGSLSGYFSPTWSPLNDWSCVTGNSQMALNWLRLAKVTGERGLVDHAVKANRFNMRLQKLDGPATMRGAIKGSHPIGGDYMTWRFPNWAAKFFMDALMFERHFDRIDNIG